MSTLQIAEQLVKNEKNHEMLQMLSEDMPSAIWYVKKGYRGHEMSQVAIQDIAKHLSRLAGEAVSR